MGITVSNSDSNYSVGVGSQPAVIPSPIQSLSPSVSSPPSPVVNVPVEKLSPRAQVDIRIGPKGATGAKGDPGDNGATGPAGPQGELGTQGPQGIPGVDSNFVYNQPVPSTSWSLTHNLNKMPSITIVDSAGTVVEGDIQYVDVNNIVVTFSYAFSGQAILN